MKNELTHFISGIQDKRIFALQKVLWVELLLELFCINSDVTHSSKPNLKMTNAKSELILRIPSQILKCNRLIISTVHNGRNDTVFCDVNIVLGYKNWGQSYKNYMYTVMKVLPKHLNNLIFLELPHAYSKSV